MTERDDVVDGLKWAIAVQTLTLEAANDEAALIVASYLEAPGGATKLTAGFTTLCTALLAAIEVATGESPAEILARLVVVVAQEGD
jgi:hypothetical protein